MTAAYAPAFAPCMKPDTSSLMVYMEVRIEELASRRAAVIVPNKVYVKRPRAVEADLARQR